MVRYVLSFEIHKISMFSTCTISAIYCFAIFQKNSIFPRFYSYYVDLYFEDFLTSYGLMLNLCTCF